MTILHQETNPSSLRARSESSVNAPAVGLVMRIHGGPQDGRLIRIPDEKCTIGSSPKCTVRFVAPEFQPLHCLIVRGQGGIAVRCWSDQTTLNGQAFTVSWMVPGDRLGLGPIELELMEYSDADPPTTEAQNRPEQQAGGELAALRQQIDAERRQSRRLRDSLLEERAETEAEWLDERRQIDEERERLALWRQEQSQAAMRADQVQAQFEDMLVQFNEQKNELADARQLLEQLLEERQELLERLAALQTELSQPGSQSVDPGLRQLSERCQQLEVELQQARSERERTTAIVAELHEEIEGAVQLRRVWEAERAQLEEQLQQVSPRGAAESGGVSECELDDLLAHGSVNDREPEVPAVDVREPDLDPAPRNESELVFSSPRETAPLDVRSVLERCGVNLPDDDSDDMTPWDEAAPSRNESESAGNPPEEGTSTHELCLDRLGPEGEIPYVDAPQTQDRTELDKRQNSSARINLSALRDLANQNARVAIDQHAHRRGLQEASYKWMVGFSAMIIGGIVTQILKHDRVLGHVLSGGCWVIAAWWFFLGSLCYRRATLIDPQRRTRRENRVMEATPSRGSEADCPGIQPNPASAPTTQDERGCDVSGDHGAT